MQRHRPLRMMPHGMLNDIFVDRPHRIDVEQERMKIHLDEIKTSLAYKPTTPSKTVTSRHCLSASTTQAHSTS